MKKYKIFDIICITVIVILFIIVYIKNINNNSQIQTTTSINPFLNSQQFESPPEQLKLTKSYHKRCNSLEQKLKNCVVNTIKDCKSIEKDLQMCNIRQNNDNEPSGGGGFMIYILISSPKR